MRRFFQRTAVFAATLILLLAGVSCQKEKALVEIPVINLPDVNHKYVMEPGEMSLQIPVETNFDWKKIEIREITGQTWCEASMKDKNMIVVTATEEGLHRNMEAQFIIENNAKRGKSEVKVPVPVSLCVTRAYIPYAINNIEGEGVAEDGKHTWKIDVPAEGGTFKFKIATDSPKWYASTSDDSKNHLTLSTIEGEPQDELAITVKPAVESRKTSHRITIKTLEPTGFAYIDFYQAPNMNFSGESEEGDWIEM